MAAHFELVRTDAEQPWHVRLVASNGAVIVSSEKYTRRGAALSAVSVAAEAFGVSMNRPPTLDPHVHPAGAPRVLGMPGLIAGVEHSFDVRYVDERG